MRLQRVVIETCLCVTTLGHPLLAQRAKRAPLGSADIDAIARLEMLEDRREFNADTLALLLKHPHSEVRRRGALAIGRIADARGRALIRGAPLDADTSVAATEVFAIGQLRDTASVPWLDSLLSDQRTPVTVATEAAAALGKIRSAGTREALARYLLNASTAPQRAAVVGEALLAIGRSPTRGDLAPITRWSSAPDSELRWRATWALFRARDPAAVRELLRLSDDTSAHVRSWAVRGLGALQADSAGVTPQAVARLQTATHDKDRRVRTEAIRALGTYADSTTLGILITALESPDSWISVSAAEGLGRLEARALRAVPSLVAATSASRPRALRITALQSLLTISPAAALAPAIAMARDSASICRLTAAQTFARLGADGRAALTPLFDDPVPQVALQAHQVRWTMDDPADPSVRRTARRDALASASLVARAAALRTMAPWADTTDLATLFDAYDRAQRDSLPWAASAAVNAIGAVQRRAGIGADAFLARFRPPRSLPVRRDIDRQLGAAVRRAWGDSRPIETGRTLADYRRIVERWVVPEYQGAVRPRSRWETPRGSIDIELYPGDAPLAVDEFVRTVTAGALAGVEFGRVVPDFVDQQRPIREAEEMRDEVNRNRLTRANVSWATGGLDTGRPGYTLGSTPQPHNEGDFTSMGRIVRGMDVADRIELGDRVLSARMLTGKP
jgi:HEAT repeat protein/cyclophilin family peptidyl-prolyl cis-trans isomerase